METTYTCIKCGKDSLQPNEAYIGPGDNSLCEYCFALYEEDLKDIEYQHEIKDKHIKRIIKLAEKMFIRVSTNSKVLNANLSNDDSVDIHRKLAECSIITAKIFYEEVDKMNKENK